jgi:hypothetical protein
MLKTSTKLFASYKASKFFVLHCFIPLIKMPKKRGAASIGSETSSDQAPRRSARAPKPTQSEGSYESPKKRSRKSPSTESHRHDSNVLEKGLLYFFYRPKLGHSEEVHNFNEVQKFYMLLAPQKMRVRDENPTKRLLIITRKKLPCKLIHFSRKSVRYDVALLKQSMKDILQKTKCGLLLT